ncbi:hypothetical protein E2C01_029427 [Portunus trituberculatus]|uniref:Uncharacterized protein n=1 Tax=Portunus trituberculatus TaxID=210409 RepID=A0A5B7ERV0_PORTR|nr:hypothetical protein [Portunus trituberculatus]
MEENKSTGGTTGHVNMGMQPGTMRDPTKIPMWLRHLADWSSTEDFLGFTDERTDMRKIMLVEKEIKCMKEVFAGLLEKQDQLFKENQELKANMW